MEQLRRRLTYANLMATAAVFIALGGTVYATNKISGKTIQKNSEPGNRIKKKTLPGNRLRNDTITGKQVSESSLGTVPSATRATDADNANPIAFARISAAGVIDQSRSKGVANATVTNPESGLYCLRNLGFAFRGAQVTADFDESLGQVATQFGSIVPAVCSPQADAYIATVGNNELGQNAGFYIVFYN